MVRLAVLLLVLVVINVVCKEECAGLDGALSFTYYGKRGILILAAPVVQAVYVMGSTATSHNGCPRAV
jgi:hypothetical protein